MAPFFRYRDSKSPTSWILWDEAKTAFSLATIINDCLSLRSLKEAIEKLHPTDLIIENAWIATIIMGLCQACSFSSGIICINSLPMAIPECNNPFII